MLTSFVLVAVSMATVMSNEYFILYTLLFIISIVTVSVGLFNILLDIYLGNKVNYAVLTHLIYMLP